MILKENKLKIGMIGSGFIVTGLADLIIQKQEFILSNILTRSDIKNRTSFKHYDLLTNSVDELLDNADIIVECSGEVEYTAGIMEKVCHYNLPVVTMNTEFHVTLGSYFADKIFITEGEGDQPGCLAALDEEAKIMGFTPLVYGNIKGFLNNNPKPDEMEFWAKKSNLSLNMVTSFTDGTKVQMEQALVANGLGATILSQGLSGEVNTDIDEASKKLSLQASNIDSPISDYVISSKGPAGVFLGAIHKESQQDSLRYYKMGDGPFYTLVKPYHLPHLEIYKTILRVVNQKTILLNNGVNPNISVASLAKKDLKRGTKISKAIGSFDIRGEAIKIDDSLSHIPVGLLNNVILKRNISKDEILEFNDVDFENEHAYNLWQKILKDRKQK
ncbi:MAG TPA: NAD(P)-dependent oxidoreductase [Arcobacter sp.]|nr:NAD(P)-dependent oxidoreductase [Arcobacter sp.]